MHDWRCNYILDRKSLIEFIANKHGLEEQSGQAMEEMGELAQALNHFNRGIGFAGSVDEEIADVQIMLWQLEYLLGCSEDVIDSIIDEKLNREVNRLET